MSDWLHALPVGWMAVVVLGGTYLAAAGIHSLVMALAKGERVRAFKAVSPGLLPPAAGGQLLVRAACQLMPGRLGRAVEAARSEGALGHATTFPLIAGSRMSGGPGGARRACRLHRSPAP